MRDKRKNNSHSNQAEPSYEILQELELEHKRIARELHDSTIQMLTMLIYKVELCENIVDKDTIRTKIELDIMKKVLKETIDDIRGTIYNLHPMSIEDLGLVASLERYLITMNRDSNIDFVLKVDGNEEKCISIINLSIYRIVQECCSNIIKHSKGTRCFVHVIYYSNTIELGINDNGIGFDQNTSNKIFREEDNLSNLPCMSGYGIPMMKERVHLLGGDIQILSGKDGTSVKVIIPLTFYKEESNE